MSIFSKIPDGDAGKTVKDAFDAADNVAQTEILNNVIATNTVLIQRQSNAKAAVQQAEAEADFLRKRIKKLKEELADAENSTDEWRTAYANLEESFAQWRASLKEWAVSHQGFKELALTYGIESLGKSREEVIEDFKIAKQRVLDNTTTYGNNSSDLNN